MFVNTSCFQEVANYFRKHGRYPDGDKDSYEYHDFWDEEHRRVYNGYECGGVRITGEHYLYSNYCPILLKNETFGQVHGTRAKHARKVGKVERDFPHFWDEDYKFFTMLNIARYGVGDYEGSIVRSMDEYRNLPVDLGLVETDDNLMGGHHFLWLKPRGVGAEQPHSEVLITPDGEITMGEVKVGTQLYDRSGKITNVIEVLPQGNKEIWKVKLLDGREVTCGENHLWTVETRIRNGKPEYKTMKTRDILASGLIYRHATGQKTYKYKLPEQQPVEFSEKVFSVPPYVLGALLGDGTISGKNIKLASDDIEIVDKVVADLNKVWQDDYTYTKDVTNNNHTLILKNKFKYLNADYNKARFGCNPLKRELTALGVDVVCEHKFIPDVYKYGSIEQRFELVRGLMDTDGSVSEQGYCEFTNKSKRLIDDLAYVLRSLGIYCSIGEDTRNNEKTIVDRNNRSTTFTQTGYFRLYIATDQPIFYLARKAIRINKKKNTRKSVPITEIYPTGEYEQQSCIIVDNAEHLYLTRDFIVTHNSYKGAVRPLYNQYFEEESRTFVLADNKEYLIKDGIITKYNEYREWINANAHGFYRNMSVVENSKMTYKASVYEEIDGRKIEKGMKSWVIGITVDGDPDKPKGKRGDTVWEEFGNFRGVADSWNDGRNASEEDGMYVYQQIGYGTGNLNKENFSSLEKMFYQPRVYNLLQIKNQWDEMLIDRPCAHFTPAYRSVRYVDKDGNSDETLGREVFDKRRADASSSSDSTDLAKEQANKPYKPAEAMLNVEDNLFPIADLTNHKLNIEVSGIYRRARNTFDLIPEKDGRIVARPNTKAPYEDFPYEKGQKRDGAIIIWFHPKMDIDTGKAVKNLYRICVDPYRHDTTTGESVGAIYVLENANRLTVTKGDLIVASFIGRPKSQPDFNRELFLLAQYYNCKIGFENDEPGGIIEYAKTHKLLDYLEEEFQLAYDANLKTKSTTRRIYGMHMGSGKDNLRKRQGDLYIKEWLLRPIGIDANGTHQLNLHRIYDIGLLEELIRYNESGNFDRISSLRVGMYYEKELIYKNRKIKQHGKKDKGSALNRFINGEFFSNAA